MCTNKNDLFQPPSRKSWQINMFVLFVWNLKWFREHSDKNEIMAAATRCWRILKLKNIGCLRYWPSAWIGVAASCGSMRIMNSECAQNTSSIRVSFFFRVYELKAFRVAYLPLALVVARLFGEPFLSIKRTWEAACKWNVNAEKCSRQFKASEPFSSRGFSN